MYRIVFFEMIQLNSGPFRESDYVFNTASRSQNTARCWRLSNCNFLTQSGHRSTQSEMASTPRLHRALEIHVVTCKPLFCPEGRHMGTLHSSNGAATRLPK